MKRKVCIIPLDEIKEHFKTNTRQDIKIIVPKIMDDSMFNFLCNKGLYPKKEEDLKGIFWEHSALGEPNKVCEAGDFDKINETNSIKGNFSLSFANKEAYQDEHYHKQHLELYYSESLIKAKYRIMGTNNIENIELPAGGVIIFGTEVIHLVEPGGITIIIEFPAVEKDKYLEKLSI